MERRSFIRNIALACLAVKVPMKWVPPAIPEEGSKGIIWHIMNQPVTVVPYRPGDFTFQDLKDMIEQEYKKPRYQHFYWYDPIKRVTYMETCQIQV